MRWIIARLLNKQIARKMGITEKNRQSAPGPGYGKDAGWLCC